MLEKNPSNRKSAEIYLSQARGKVFPEYFYSFLQSYMLIFSAAPILSPDEKINRLKNDIGNIINILRAEENSCGKNMSDTDKTESQKNSQATTNIEASKEDSGHSEDNTITEMDSDHSSEKYDSHTTEIKDMAKLSLQDTSDVKNEGITREDETRRDTPAENERATTKIKTDNHDDEKSKSSDKIDGLIIITQLVTSCIRGLHHSQSKLQSLEILLQLAENTSDETILDRILPYIVSKLNLFYNRRAVMQLFEMSGKI